MTITKALQWAITFSALTLFTVYAVNNMGERRVERVYAQTFSEPGFQGKYLVNVETNAQNLGQETRARTIMRVIERFTNLLNREQELCGITEEQFQMLSQRYETVVEEIPAGNTRIPIVKINGGSLMKSDLQNILGVGVNVHCKLVEVYDQIILHLSAHLS